MNRTFTALIAATVLLVPAMPLFAADAAAAANTVTCKDGASSKGGRGACRGHGGIKRDKAPTAAATSAAPAAVPAAAAPAAAGSGKSVSSDPTGAIAQCKDGSYSHSKGHKGACSRHGGVEKWLDQG